MNITEVGPALAQLFVETKAEVQAATGRGPHDVHVWSVTVFYERYERVSRTGLELGAVVAEIVEQHRQRVSSQAAKRRELDALAKELGVTVEGHA